MTFEQLNCFIEVYHYKSIKKAADHLYKSYQAVSQSIKALETEFDTLFFNRLSNGVEPSKAGQAFYQHAIKIITETAALHQHMQQFKATPTLAPICKIGMVNLIMNLYGEKILETLSAQFPDTYFDLSTITVKDIPNNYLDYDLIITFLTDTSFSYCSFIAETNYKLKKISDFQLYVWLSAFSPYTEYKTLSLDLLKNEPFCVLKNTFGGLNWQSFLDIHNYPIVEFEKLFINRIENFGYYTVDIQINDRLILSELFQEAAVVSKDTTESLSLYMIYDPKKAGNFLTALYDILPIK